MKRSFTTTIGKKDLELSLSFATSLDLLDKVGSPSAMLQDIVEDSVAGSAGLPRNAKFKLTERNAVEILVIGNKDYQGLSFQEMGELCFRTGFINIFGTVVDYLGEIISSHSDDVDEIATEVGDTEKEAGN